MQNIWFFKQISEEIRDNFIPYMKEIIFHQNDIIAKEGEVGTYIYILVNGKVDY